MGQPFEPHRKWPARLGAATASSLLCLAFAPVGLWWLAWIGLAPVVALVARAPSTREAAVIGWIGGTAFFVSLHHWLLPSVGIFVVPLGPLVGAAWIPWAIVDHAFLRRRSVGAAASALVLVPATWVAIEGLRSWKHLGGTWGLIGLTQWNNGPVLQAASLGGVWLLSVLLIVFNTGLAAALLQPRWRERLMVLALTAVLPVAGVAHGLLRGDSPTTGTLRLAGVQPGLVHGADDRLAAHERLTRDLARGTRDYDFVVWGQSSVGFDPEASAEVDRRLTLIASDAGRDVFVNVDARGAQGRITKSMRQYTPTGVMDVYEKRRLVPFGEYVPLRSVFGWVSRVSDAAEEDRVPGTQSKVMRAGGAWIGPLISYESTFPDMRRAVVRDYPDTDLTLVQAASTTFQGSWAQPQQASFEAVRAVESGRAAALVAVSGVSAVFDSRGRRLAWIAADERRSFVVELPLSREQTLYVRWGDWVLRSSWAALAVAAVAVTWRCRFRRPTSGIPPSSR